MNLQKRCILCLKLIEGECGLNENDYEDLQGISGRYFCMALREA